MWNGFGGPMTPFNITNGNAALGQATFMGGNNIVTFGVVNDSTNHGAMAGGNTPTGVRVYFTSATASVPEPGMLVLMGAGLIGLTVVARRRRVAA